MSIPRPSQYLNKESCPSGNVGGLSFCLIFILSYPSDSVPFALHAAMIFCSHHAETLASEFNQSTNSWHGSLS
jgi:hypothetical protein